jgi:diguanylate cyclase (GGDEF)-like protein
MKPVNWLFWLLLACCAPYGAAQGLHHAGLRFDTIGDAEVITDGVVRAVVQDASGVLWLGTAEGIIRYDGYRFKKFSLGDAANPFASTMFVTSLLAAKDGTLWAGTSNNILIHFDPLTETTVHYQHAPADRDSIASGSQEALALDGETGLWIGTTGGGLEHLDLASGHFTHITAGAGDTHVPDNRIDTLLTDRAGNLWVGTWKGLVRRARGEQRFTTVRAEQDAPDGLAVSRISMLGEGADGRIWVGTWKGDLAVVDPLTARGAWIDHPSGGAERHSPIFSMARVGAENWLARADGIDVRSAVDGHLVHHYRSNSRLPGSLVGNPVRSLCADRSGWLWVGSYGGLQRINVDDAGVWVRRRDDDERSVLAEADIRSIVALRSGEIWVGTNERGVAILDQALAVVGEIRPVRDAGAAFRGGQVSAMAQARADDTVWLAGDERIYEYDGATHAPRNAYPTNEMGRPKRMLVDSDNRLLVGSQDGLFRFDAADRRFVRMRPRGGLDMHGHVNAIVEGAGHDIWVGGEAGLFWLGAGKQELESVALPTTAIVLGLLYDRGNSLWVDTTSGLLRLTGWDGKRAHIERVGADLGLGGRSFGANLLEDRRGRIWTHRGVFDPSDASYYALTAADGAEFGTGWFRSYAQLADGRMLFGGGAGMLVVEPDRFKRWAFLPPLVVSDVRVGGLHVPVGKPGAELKLASTERGFSFEFAALDYSNPARNRYQYQLQGFDERWIDLGADQRIASFGRLAPGRYLMRVRGSNRAGVWSPGELAIPIEVTPAWWQTWWARLSGLTMAGAALYALVLAYTGLLRRRALMLERMVGARTVELETLSLALTEASLTDPLTGFRNRRFLHDNVRGELALSVRRHFGHLRHGTPLGDNADLIFFIIDVDHFKSINDEHGHAAGDAVLVQLCDRLRQSFRDSDIMVRWGGEEFLVIARATSRACAPALAERVCAAVAQTPFVLDDGRQLYKTCSLGYACFPLAPGQPEALEWAELVEMADAALFEVKRNGRNGWLGLQSALADAPEDVRVWIGRPLEDWAAHGGLTLAGRVPARVVSTETV